MKEDVEEEDAHLHGLLGQGVEHGDDGLGLLLIVLLHRPQVRLVLLGHLNHPIKPGQLGGQGGGQGRGQGGGIFFKMDRKCSECVTMKSNGQTFGIL